MRYIIWTSVIVAVLVIVYLAYVVVTSWLEVKAAPKEAMFYCQKHGSFLKSEVIDFSGQPYCTRCFYEKLNQQGNNRL